MPQEMPHFDVANLTLKEIAQSMLEVKKMGRSAENAADAFLPLTSNSEVVEILNDISGHGKLLADAASNLYRMIAREAASA